MQTFEFVVREILERKVRIDAESKGEAENCVENLYSNEQIVLDAEDMAGEEEIELVNISKNVIDDEEFRIDHFVITNDGVIDKFDER